MADAGTYIHISENILKHKLNANCFELPLIAQGKLVRWLLRLI